MQAALRDGDVSLAEHGAHTESHPGNFCPLQAVQARLPNAPLEVGISPHWLAIAGVQPAIAENAQPKRAAALSKTVVSARGAAGAVRSGQAPGQGTTSGSSVAHHGEAAGGIMAGLPLKHSMPDELQLYYDMVRRALQTVPGQAGGLSLEGQAVAASLATDPGSLSRASCEFSLDAPRALLAWQPPASFGRRFCPVYHSFSTLSLA